MSDVQPTYSIQYVWDRRKVVIKIDDAQPIDCDTRSGQYQPDDLVIVYDRDDADEEWRCSDIAVSGNVVKRDGSAGKTRHTLSSSDLGCRLDLRTLYADHIQRHMPAGALTPSEQDEVA